VVTSVRSALPGLLHRRLIFVTGKGGVGKSTVSVALGLLAARLRKRTIVVELAGQGRVRGAFSQEGETFQEVALSENLWTISVAPEAAMEEYLRLRTGPLGQALGASRIFQTFAMATPGMRELLTMGKVWELAQPQRRTSGAEPYDLVIVDAPAAGHGLAILRTPRTFAEIARVGPIAGLAQRIAATLEDPSLTAVIAVAGGEEMPVNETLWLNAQLAEDGRSLDAVVVNGLEQTDFSAAEADRLRGARPSVTSPLGSAALAAAISAVDRAAAQREQVTRLYDGLGGEVARAELPFVFTEHLGVAQLDGLADALSAEAWA
jgi:anion-transporting  ArsA/GET3 family ATPase